MAGSKTEVATLGGGCFWCTEAVFEEVDGVKKVVSGYAGGDGPADYKAVCSGTTGHAECVQITYDPEKIGYRDILTVFFRTHDPTTLNRQGADRGTQYRSVIFVHDAEQKKLATEAISILTAEKVFDKPIVTEIAPYEGFHAAEDYHQDYYRNNKQQGYCQAVISPKMAKFRKEFADKLK
ncbi:peptide-methionine (S)-S-oxide reductase MsrA [bacterium]|nr:peptide-methionine (S)-S-oxide reductase MsrA [bacterium]